MELIIFLSFKENHLLQNCMLLGWSDERKSSFVGMWTG